MFCCTTLLDKDQAHLKRSLWFLQLSECVSAFKIKHKKEMFKDFSQFLTLVVTFVVFELSVIDTLFTVQCYSVD